MKQKFHKSEIAKQQLMTALALFLNKMDLSSVITLAGAAGNILNQLALNQKKEPFFDFGRRVVNSLRGFMPKRDSYIHFVNEKFGINVHKHMSKYCPETIEINLHKCAYQALGKAFGDYVTIYGQEEAFVKAFYNWAWENLDGPKNGRISKPPRRTREMSLQTYKRFDLAANQLRTAIDLFLSRPSRDNFSVITLAGAADTIFAELVSRRKKENFTDHFIKEKNDTRKLGEIGKEINDTLFINDLKHMDPGEDGHIEMDVHECAIAAILKAISNYNMLEEKDPKLIGTFLTWVRTNLDPKKYNIFCDPNWKSPDGP